MRVPDNNEIGVEFLLFDNVFAEKSASPQPINNKNNKIRVISVFFILGHLHSIITLAGRDSQ